MDREKPGTDPQMAHAGPGVRDGRWPPPDAGLAALVDLGLSDEAIALYFVVGTDCVHRRRHRLGIHRLSDRPADHTTGSR